MHELLRPHRRANSQMCTPMRECNCSPDWRSWLIEIFVRAVATLMSAVAVFVSSVSTFVNACCCIHERFWCIHSCCFRSFTQLFNIHPLIHLPSADDLALDNISEDHHLVRGFLKKQKEAETNSKEKRRTKLNNRVRAWTCERKRRASGRYL